MTGIVVDVESDGQAPGLYSMVCFGAVIIEDPIVRTFYGTTAPISDQWEPQALAVSGFSREQHLAFDDPAVTMQRFADWLEENRKGKLLFFSDNNGYDWQFINYYFHRYLGKNPFGWSSRNINDIWKGMQKDMYSSFKHLRKTKHDHHPVNDAKGNAEALLAMKKMGLRL
jgi:DNA polymerase III epsilon subunit-like protein